MDCADGVRADLSFKRTRAWIRHQLRSVFASSSFVKMWNPVRLERFLFIAVLTVGYSLAFPMHTNEDFRFVDREYASPGAHQLASWLTYQLRPKEFVAQPIEEAIIPYRLPITNSGGKRNSEVNNAMINSEETQKMYHLGRK